jgi:multicomponent K+:H+ antiporter subunit G
MSPTPFWVEAVVATLLVSSGIFVVISALGFLRLQDFFLRMHPPALAYTFGSWSVTLAGIVYFSTLEARAVLHPWLIIIILSITVPVTTLLLARVALFRRRAAGATDTPGPLSVRSEHRNVATGDFPQSLTRRFTRDDGKAGR